MNVYTPAISMRRPSEARHSRELSLAVDLILTNQQIAARIGTVREVVSRPLNRRQQDGLLRVEGRRVFILDEGVMKSYTGE